MNQKKPIQLFQKFNKVFVLCSRSNPKGSFFFIFSKQIINLETNNNFNKRKRKPQKSNFLLEEQIFFKKSIFFKSLQQINYLTTTLFLTTNNKRVELYPYFLSFWILLIYNYNIIFCDNFSSLHLILFLFFSHSFVHISFSLHFFLSLHLFVCKFPSLFLIFVYLLFFHFNCSLPHLLLPNFQLFHSYPLFFFDIVFFISKDPSIF